MMPSLPYSRFGYQKDILKKYKFTYDEHSDIYIYPNRKVLISNLITNIIKMNIKEINIIAVFVHLKTNIII